MRRTAHALIFLIFTLLNGSLARAMEMSINGDQLIASGPVAEDDVAHFRSLVETNPALTTVVLSDSHGGSGAAEDAIVGEIEARGLDTVVSGYCVSACAMIFLAGKNRFFGDGAAIEMTSLGFHGDYDDRDFTLLDETRLKTLKERIILRTGGKIEATLVDRWLHLHDPRGSVRFRYPGAPLEGPSTFFCPVGRFPNEGHYDDCNAIPDTDALSSGIITSRRIVHVK